MTVHNVRVRTGAGTVTLELPHSIDAGINVEVTHAEKFSTEFKRADHIFIRVTDGDGVLRQSHA